MQMPGYPPMSVANVGQPAYLHSQASAAGWVPMASAPGSAPASAPPPQYNPEWDADGDGLPDN